VRGLYPWRDDAVDQRELVICKFAVWFSFALLVSQENLAAADYATRCSNLMACLC
jgi:hypothetical protein